MTILEFEIVLENCEIAFATYRYKQGALASGIRYAVWNKKIDQYYDMGVNTGMLHKFRGKDRKVIKELFS